MNKAEIFFTKLSWIAFALALVFIATFFLIQKKPKNFDGSRVALVDSSGKNFLFRGSNPFVKKDGKVVFAYDELKNYFSEILENKGMELPQDFYLVDVSLLDMDEYYEIKKEQAFFKKNPKQGHVLSISTPSSALLFSELEHNLFTYNIVENYNSWITHNLDILHKILEEKSDKPVVIYVHCNGGRDRSGFILASYRMLFKNMDLDDVNLQNRIEVGRSSEGFYQSAITSYCYYLQEKYGKTSGYCLTKDPNNMIAISKSYKALVRNKS